MSRWPTKKLGDVCDLQNGLAFQSSQYVEAGYFVLRITNVQNGHITLNNPKYIDDNYPDSFDSVVLQENDILISLTGNVGRVGMVQAEHLPAVLNQRVARFVLPVDAEVTNEYLFHFLLTPRFQKQVIAGGKGMAQQNVSTKHIKEISIPVPPKPEQAQIVQQLRAQLEQVDAVTDLTQNQLTSFTALRSAYLDEAFE